MRFDTAYTASNGSLTRLSQANEEDGGGKRFPPYHTLGLGIFALYAIVTWFMFLQWTPILGSALIGPPGDNQQDFWNTWYTSVGADLYNFFFTNLIRFPEGTSLYYHSFAYPKVFAIALLSKVVGADLNSLILLQNLSLLASFPLAAVGTFYLVRHLTGNTVGALIGGFIFAFNPSHIVHTGGNAHVSSIEFIPFFCLCYIMALERKNILWLGSAIIFYVLSALSCWYYLFYIAYFIGFHSIYVSLRDRALPKSWQLLSPVACLIGIVVALSPILVAMVQLAVSGVSVYESGTDEYVADIFAYPAFPPFHLLQSLTKGIYSRLSGNFGTATVYLGLINIVVLGWLCFRARHKDHQLLAYVLCGMAVFCILASGDSLHVLGHRTIPMPGAILSDLPFFKNVRTPSRAIVFVYLFLAIGIGHAVALALQPLDRASVRWGIAVVAVLMVLDFYPYRLAVTPVSCSPGFSIIRDDPQRGFGILDLPRGEPQAMEGNFYMLYQAACHSRPIAGGITSRDVAVSLIDRLETQDMEAQRQQLADAKIKYIIIHEPTNPARLRFGWLRNLFQWRPADGHPDEYLRTYPTAYKSVDLTILQVY